MRACLPPPARSPRPPRASHRYTCLPAATREPGGQARALSTPLSRGSPCAPSPLQALAGSGSWAGGPLLPLHPDFNTWYLGVTAVHQHL